MTYFMVLRWNDDRFLRKDSGAQSDNRHVTLYGTDTDWENIWIPDIYLVNEIPSGLLDYVPTDFIQIYENGTLKMSRRYYLTCNSKFILLKYIHF